MWEGRCCYGGWAYEQERRRRREKYRVGLRELGEDDKKKEKKKTRQEIKSGWMIMRKIIDVVIRP